MAGRKHFFFFFPLMHSNNSARKQAKREMQKNERKDGREGRACGRGMRKAELRNLSWLLTLGKSLLLSGLPFLQPGQLGR